MSSSINNSNSLLSPREALERAVNCAKAGFSESIDVTINLKLESRKSQEHLKGITILPKGIGRKIKVAIFAKSEKLQELKESLVNNDDEIVFIDENIMEDVKNGSKKLDVDWCLTTPDFMSSVAVLAKKLGPKGLMPNPKYGTVSANIIESVKKIKEGQIKFASDKNGVVHAKIGNVKFSLQDLLENYEAFINAIKQLKPQSIKGSYFKDIFISSTMGRSFKISNMLMLKIN